MKKLFTLLLIISCHLLQAQNFLPKFIKKMYFNNDTSKKHTFVVLPVIASAPETGFEAGGTALLSFYTDTLDRSTRVSNLFGFATATTKGQSRFSISTNYWTPHNKNYYSATISYQNFPFEFYGIGNNTRKVDADHVSEKRLKFNLTGQTLAGSHIYVGYVAGAFNYSYSDKNTTGIFYTSPLVEDRTGGGSFFVGPTFVYDSRNNNTYTTKGLIVTSYFNMMQGVFGNNSYRGGLFNIEYSQFFSLSKKLVLGVDIQEQSLTGGRSPFYLLPQLGNDEVMRGYYGGRYRDRDLIAGQTELRYRINGRIGVIAFVGAGEVFHSDFSFPGLKPDYGAGLRYFFDVDKGLALRMDYGVGQKPAGEPRESGFYVSLGQSF